MISLSVSFVAIQHIKNVGRCTVSVRLMHASPFGKWQKAKEMKEFNIVIHLGEFHIALNHLSLLGKKFQNSGLDDLLIESGVYAAGTTSAIMKGKSYNRGIHVHNLAMKALFHLKWDAFCCLVQK